MNIANRKLQRIATLPLAAILVCLGGCGYFSSAPAAVAYTRVATIPRLGDIDEPFGIAVKDEMIYVSDGESGTIRRIDAAGVASTTVSGFHTPSAIAFLPSGELVVADSGSHTIRKVSEDGMVTIVAGVDGS